MFFINNFIYTLYFKYKAIFTYLLTYGFIYDVEYIFKACYGCFFDSYLKPKKIRGNVFLQDGESLILKNKLNDDVVKEIVDELMAEDNIDKPFDFLFRSSSDYLPKACHEVLQLPGIFEEKLNPNIFSFTGRSLEADYIEKVRPDYKEIFDPAIIIVDHMSYRLNCDKIDSSFEYKISKIMKSKNLCYLYIVTNIDYDEEVLIEISHFDHFSIRVILFDEERIYKMLSMLIEKDYSKYVFSDVDLISFIYCLIFSKKPFAKDVISKLVGLFASIDNISSEYRIYMQLALKIMIKYNFTEKKEIRGLLTMITKTLNSKDIDEISLSMSYEERITRLKASKNQVSSLLVETQLELVESKNDVIKKDKTIAEQSKTIAGKDKTIAEQSKTIAGKDKTIAEMEKALSEKDKAIAEMEKALSENEKARSGKDMKS